MKLILFALLLMIGDVCLGNRIYIRHKRSTERESDSPGKESTVVVQSNKNNSLDGVKDFENEISSNEKDCKDLFEMDYNPFNDTLFFNGRIPQLFNTHRLSTIDDMFKKVFDQMFQQFRFPTMPNHNYPDNYNGTVQEEVIIDGKKFLKKQHIINKTKNGSKISIMSTVYEPVNGTEIENETNSTTGPIISY